MVDVKQSFRQAGKNPRKGRIIKGPLNDAHNRSTQASIPSTYEVIITDDNLRDQKGFGSTSWRFGPQHNNIPGPGSYASTRSHSSSSANRRGAGDFISNNKRFKAYQYATVGPGPASYVPPAQKVKTCERPFKTNVYPQPPTPLPAPTDYSPEKQGKNIAIVSAFKSEAKRELRKDATDVPAPCDYDPKKQFGLAQPANASFKHPSYLRRYQVNLYDPHAPVVMPKFPGPGQYNTIQPSEEKADRSLSMFAYSTKDRFGNSVMPRVNRARPAPGDYEYSYVEDEPLPVSGAVFMSETDRVVIKTERKPPGPAYYTTRAAAKKKSFHLNTSNNWL